MVPGDATSDDDLAAAVGQAAGPDGRLDGLVCAAGLPPDGPWDDRERWDAILARRPDRGVAGEPRGVARPHGRREGASSSSGASSGRPRARSARRPTRPRRPGSRGSRGRSRSSGRRTASASTSSPPVRSIRRSTSRCSRPTRDPTCRSGGWAGPTRWRRSSSFLLSEAASYVSGATWTRRWRSDGALAGRRGRSNERRAARSGREPTEAPTAGGHDGRAVAAAPSCRRVRERVGHGVPRRGHATRRRARHLRGRALREHRGRRRRDRCRGPRRARRPAPLHARCRLVGDPRGWLAARRGPARRCAARAARGDRGRGSRVAAHRPLPPLELGERRGGVPLPRDRPRPWARRRSTERRPT